MMFMKRDEADYNEKSFYLLLASSCPIRILIIKEVLKTDTVFSCSISFMIMPVREQIPEPTIYQYLFIPSS